MSRYKIFSEMVWEFFRGEVAILWFPPGSSLSRNYLALTSDLIVLHQKTIFWKSKHQKHSNKGHVSQAVFIASLLFYGN